MSDSRDGFPAAKRQRTSYSRASPTALTSNPLDAGNPTSLPPQIPSSPAVTSSGPHLDALSSTPQFYAFTPPASAPMSAEPSQQPLLLSTHPPIGTQPTIDAYDLPQASPNAEITTSTAKYSTLHTPPTDPTVGSEDVSVKAELGRTDHDRESLDPDISGLDGRHDFSVGENIVYKRSQSTYSAVQPRFSQNFFALYGLEEIATGVARYNLSTGVKNPLRKSYQNFINDVSGKNKPMSKPREFMDLLYYADDDWHSQKVFGKRIEAGISPDVLAKLDQAVTMETGKLPKVENDLWKNTLDLDDQSTKLNTAQPLGIKSSTSKLSVQSLTNTSSATGPPRLSRRGTKRRYNDDAFEGYGEGYLDDVGDSPNGDQDDEENRGSGKKKRRRVGPRPR